MAGFAVPGSRVDLLVTEGENEYVLEVNTLPGMTPTSLLPKIAAHAMKTGAQAPVPARWPMICWVTTPAADPDLFDAEPRQRAWSTHLLGTGYQCGMS